MQIIFYDNANADIFRCFHAEIRRRSVQLQLANIHYCTFESWEVDLCLV